MMKRRILIIDDEVSFAEMVKSNLELTGKYEVRTENNGGNALSSARDFKPEIILLDIIMPGVSGVRVADELSKDEELKSIPVIFLTAVVTTDKTVNQDIIINKRPFLAKPISINDLIAGIEKYA